MTSTRCTQIHNRQASIPFSGSAATQRSSAFARTGLAGGAVAKFSAPRPPKYQNGRVANAALLAVKHGNDRQVVARAAVFITPIAKTCAKPRRLTGTKNYAQALNRNYGNASDGIRQHRDAARQPPYNGAHRSGALVRDLAASENRPSQRTQRHRLVPAMNALQRGANLRLRQGASPRQTIALTCTRSASLADPTTHNLQRKQSLRSRVTIDRTAAVAEFTRTHAKGEDK